MRAWIIIDGEKAGPFDIAQVARKIEAGEYTSDMHGWIEGMKQWQPLAQIPQFAEVFQRPREVESALPPASPPVVSAHPLSPAAWNVPLSPPQERVSLLVRRFFARWFDMVLWSSVFLCAMYLAGANMKAMVTNFWSSFLMMMVWILLESAMLHAWGVTPGKWLLGMRVARPDGTRLSVGLSLLRSVRVYLMGMGMNHPVLMLLCHGFSWWFVRRHGATLWDGSSGIHVSMTPITAWRWLGLALTTLLVILISSIILQPVSQVIYQEMFPEQAQLPESAQPPTKPPQP